MHLSANGCHESDLDKMSIVSLALMYWSRYLWMSRDWAGLFMEEAEGKDLFRWCYSVNSYVKIGLEIVGMTLILSLDSFLVTWLDLGCYCLIEDYVAFFDYFFGCSCWAYLGDDCFSSTFLCSFITSFLV